jgi:GTP-binding protein Era
MSGRLGACTSTADHKSGFVGLVGPPNVGKSTLLNRILGQKIAIVSPKPQTTRNRIRGIRSSAGAQIVYVDTPGFHTIRDGLGRSMAAAAAEGLEGVDVVVWVVDAGAFGSGLDEAAQVRLRAARCPSILALNMIDRVKDKRVLLKVMERAAGQHDFRALVPISAKTGDGVDRLEAAILEELRPGPPLYPADTVTDQPETFFVAERVREKIFLLTHREVPYAIAVQVEELVERQGSGVLYIRARVSVEEPSQRAIVLGAGGERLRAIGQAARLDLERFFGVRVFLDLRVQVRRQWRRDDRALREFGYLLKDEGAEN